MANRRLRVLTWHVHGNYLHYLSHAPHEFYVLNDGRGTPGYRGRCGGLPWRDNVFDAPVERLAGAQFDCVLYQSRRGYEQDRHELLTPAQRALPSIYLEHDPPQGHPTDTCHWVNERNMLLVHCTAFNALMWESGITPVTVIEHGVALMQPARYTGKLPQGLVVVNNLARRGRRLGADVFLRARERIPLDLVGMNAKDLGGLGEVEHLMLPQFMAEYRFFFNPIRYTSLGLAVIEAMMVGLPVVALATTEMPTVVFNGVNGFIDTREDALIRHMRQLIEDVKLARSMGDCARRLASGRFAIGRFAADWDRTLRRVCA